MSFSSQGNARRDATTTTTSHNDEQQQQDDEWIFSMQLPRDCVITARVGGLITKKKLKKSVMIQMRQSQPPQQPSLYSHATPTPAAAAATVTSSFPPKDNMIRSSSSSNDDDTESQQVELVALAQERASLLASSSSLPPPTTTTTTTPAKKQPIASTATATTGWTLQSPYWSIQSDIILQVTYRPAWQGLPEFTNLCQACGKCSNSSSSINKKKSMHWWKRNALSAAVATGSFCCGGCCKNNGTSDDQSKIDFMTHTWTIHDIVTVREISNYNTIVGIGSCRAIEIELKPLLLPDDDLFTTVPPLLKSAWEHHVHELLQARIHNNNNQSSTTTTKQPGQQQQRTTTRRTSDVSSSSSSSGGNSSSDGSFDATITTRTSHKSDVNNKNDDDHPHDDAACTASTTTKGPTIIFCLPYHHIDPPLLYKVIFPPLTQTAIAMETITVMEGSLLLVQNNQKARKQQTTPPSSPGLARSKSSPAPAAPAAPAAAPAAVPPSFRQSQPHTVNNNNTTIIHPTHIYITGYQSWSFAGSVARGCKQPTSALPQVFSRAFNLGGTPPPPTTTTTTTPTAIACLLDEDGNNKNVNCNVDDSRHAADDDSNEEEDLPLPPVSAYYQGQEIKEAAFYQSNFFTCITSDGGQQQQQEFVDNVTAATTTHLDERGGPALLLGWLSQHEQFGVITADKSLQQFAMHASTHGQIILPTSTTADQKGVGLTTDWAYVQLISPHSYDEEPMVHYLHSVAAYNQARPLQNGPLLTGWCSWYHYYANISESNLRENFAKLAAMRTKVPTNVAVVDDGYMTAWGDWGSLKPDDFSNMEIVSRDIQAQGMRPGLWLAPFAADKDSKLVQEHPDWIIRNDRGIPANSSYCGKFFYGLDATNPAVRQYVFECIRRAVHDWKFNVLKIDFLYAACLHGNGKYDLSMSRAQAMHLALQTIRDAAGPDVFLIGCGCPIAVGIGYVDGMRISADTGPTWKPVLPLPYWDNSTLPCLRSMVRNSLSRAPLGHRWWHNDPDCLLLGESTRLSDEEVATAASIVAMTCGMMLLSDDLTRVSAARMRILTKIFPMIGATAVVLDLHSATSEGMPSLLRLWCSDKYNLVDAFGESFASSDGGVSTHSKDRDHNAEATFFARAASFQFDVEEITSPNERKRSCIHVTKGLETWTVVSISNWSDKAEVLHVPELALLPPPSSGFDGGESDSFLGTTGNIQDRGCNGYHVFAFWSSKYSWLPDQTRHSNEVNSNGENDCSADYTLSKRLAPHETEIFHIKPVTPDRPQYIGSDIHFSCGKEVLSFRATAHSMQICLKTDYKRVGHIFVFIPRIHTDSNSVQVTVSGKPGRSVAVGNTPSFQGGDGVGTRTSPRLVGRVLCIQVVVHADGSLTDGHVNIEF